VRFVPWIMPWFCLAVASLFTATPARWGKITAAFGFAILIGWQIQQDVTMPPNQPIREGIQLADKIVPPDRDILIVYLGARESMALYGDTQHQLLPGPDVTWMLDMQRQELRQTGHLPWVIIFYEQLARDRDPQPGDAHGMWRSLMANYHLAHERLPGRLTPVAIYAPNENTRR